MFLHPENKQATLVDMRTVQSVAAKREFLISFMRLGTAVVLLAERCLVRAWAGVMSTTTGKTFNQLRVDYYTSSIAGINDLHPTNRDNRGYIHRGSFPVNRACKLLATDNEREARLESVEH